MKPAAEQLAALMAMTEGQPMFPIGVSDRGPQDVEPEKSRVQAAKEKWSEQSTEAKIGIVATFSVLGVGAVAAEAATLWYLAPTFGWWKIVALWAAMMAIGYAIGTRFPVLKKPVGFILLPPTYLLFAPALIGALLTVVGILIVVFVAYLVVRVILGGSKSSVPLFPVVVVSALLGGIAVYAFMGSSATAEKPQTATEQLWK